MPVIVRFTTASGPCAVPVEQALEVCTADAVRPLPSVTPGVTGVLDRAGVAVPVLDALASRGGHVLVLRSASATLGVLVEEVTGVARVATDAVGPPPEGRSDPLIGATVREDGVLTFVLDVEELARSLGGEP